MPSFDHETLVDLFRQRPSLAKELLSGALGVALPAHGEVEIAESELGEVQPLETRTDLVVLLRDEARVVFAPAVEVQLGPNAEKTFRWPLYAVTLRARHRCPTAVLVLGPDEVPLDGTSAELALLSVRAHGDGPRGLDLARAALASIAGLEEGRRELYHDALMAWVTDAIRRELEMIGKSYYPQSEFAREHYGRGKEEGKLEGEAALLRRLLERRFGALPEALEARLGSADADQLLRWSDRLWAAASAEDVLTDP